MGARSVPVDDDSVQGRVNGELAGTFLGGRGLQGLDLEVGLPAAVVAVPGADPLGDLGGELAAAGTVADDAELPQLAALRGGLVREAPGEVGQGPLVDDRGGGG